MMLAPLRRSLGFSLPRAVARGYGSTGSASSKESHGGQAPTERNMGETGSSAPSVRIPFQARSMVGADLLRLTVFSLLPAGKWTDLRIPMTAYIAVRSDGRSCGFNRRLSGSSMMTQSGLFPCSTIANASHSRTTSPSPAQHLTATQTRHRALRRSRRTSLRERAWRTPLQTQT